VDLQTLSSAHGPLDRDRNLRQAGPATLNRRYPSRRRNFMVGDLRMLFRSLAPSIQDFKILPSNGDEWGCAQLAASHREGVGVRELVCPLPVNAVAVLRVRHSICLQRQSAPRPDLQSQYYFCACLLANQCKDHYIDDVTARTFPLA